MGYVSKYNRTFISFVKRKYVKYGIDFKTWDDYALWLYYKYCKEDYTHYYKELERDIWDYSDFQTGTPRKREQGQKNDSWKLLEEE